MFRKVHLRLTLLCAGITSFILVTMSFLFLFLSENSLLQSQLLSFQRDMNMILSDFEQQTIITPEWLSRQEAGGAYRIYVLDNGVPLFFNSKTGGEQKKGEYAEIKSYYDLTLRPSVTVTAAKPGQEFFFFTTSYGSRFHVYYVTLQGKRGVTELVVLSSLSRLDRQIREQRLRFFMLNLAAIACLLLFSWLFTRFLLSPVEKSRKQQAEFIAAVSHELRTPLAVILSCTSAAKKASSCEREGFLNTIQNETQRMNRLINDMLLLSQADNHTFDLRLEMMAADTKLIDLYEGFLPMAAEKKLTLSIQLPPEPFRPCLCDEMRFCQIITILLHNAISYTPEGGRILLSLECDTPASGEFTVSVADNGHGIPDAEKENIFRRFYRMDSSRQAKDHYGLGLSIAAEIVSALNGSLTVTDTPGGGSTFIVVLPAVPLK